MAKQKAKPVRKVKELVPAGYDMPLYQSTVKGFLQANDGGSGKRRK
jgi:hypothetical protein